MMPEMKQLPWLVQSRIEQVAHGYANAHAVLLSGPEYTGKTRLAERVAHFMLECPHKSNASELFRAGSHPDLHVLTSAHAWQDLGQYLQQHAMRYLDPESLEKKRLSRQISVNTVRSMISSLEESSTLGGKKMVIIAPAEQLNINSANALLKFLEEPTRDSLLLLVCHDLTRIPATIRSRCMKLDMPLPDPAEMVSCLESGYPDKARTDIEAALALAGNRPLLAERYLAQCQQEMVRELLADVHQLFTRDGNPVALARKWLKYKQTGFILDWLRKLLCDLVRLRLNSGSPAGLFNQPSQLESLGLALDTHALFSVYDYFNSLNQKNDAVIDETLVLEDVILVLSKANSTNI